MRKAGAQTTFSQIDLTILTWQPKYYSYTYENSWHFTVCETSSFAMLGETSCTPCPSNSASQSGTHICTYFPACMVITEPVKKTY